MRTVLYLFSLLLSLPNLLAGVALAVLQHTFVSRNPLILIARFFEAVFWAAPASAAALLVLIMAGFFFETRRYAAILALLLNVAALSLVFLRLGSPDEFGELFVFIPVVLAFAGLGWLTWSEFRTAKPRAT